MTVSVFLTWSGPEDEAAAFAGAFAAGPLESLASPAGLSFVESYRPAPGGQPDFDAVPRPPLLVELNFERRESARECVASATFRNALTLNLDGGDHVAAVDVFEPRHFPLPDRPQPPPRTAPLSYVVRYFRPAPDEHAFVDFYVNHHPLLLARFPRIRNVLCYLPAGIDLPDDIASSGAFFGNEVVFDDLGDLQRALDSAVLPELLAEGKLFPPYGHNEHHAMLRERLYPPNIRPQSGYTRRH